MVGHDEGYENRCTVCAFHLDYGHAACHTLRVIPLAANEGEGSNVTTDDTNS